MKKSIQYELEPFRLANFESSYCKKTKICNGWIHFDGGYRSFRDFVAPEWMELGKIYTIQITEK